MELEKLRHLLEHWIEHNHEHIAKYKEWAERVRDDREDVARLIDESIEFFERGNDALKKALERL